MVLRAGILRKCSSSKLEISDYEHLSIKTDDILEYLKNCQKAQISYFMVCLALAKPSFVRLVLAGLKKSFLRWYFAMMMIV